MSGLAREVGGLDASGRSTPRVIGRDDRDELVAADLRHAK
jgi:hypothetical protein